MKKVILLEDEEKLARLYKRKLEEYGFFVLWTQTVQETIEKAENFLADCVFIDHGIRGNEQSGIEILPFFKKKFPQTKLVMLSNYNHKQLLTDALTCGADDFLVKINYPPKKLAEYTLNIFRSEETV